MAILRATVTLDQISGVDRDEVKNVWHFETAGAITPGNMNAAGAGLEAFYRALGDRFGSQISRVGQAHRVDFAAVTQGGPGEADDVTTKVLGSYPFSLAGLGGTAASLPSEVAVALSFRGNVIGIPEEAPGGLVRPASQRRGRIFLGPLVQGVLEMDNTTKRVRFMAGFLVQVVDAYDTGALPLWKGSADAVRHIVYSRKAAATHPVVHVHCDDAPDTVRRRGERATSRATRDVVQSVI